MSEGEFDRARIAVRPSLWLNLVCLDAPLVAVSWAWLIARAFQIAVRPEETAALFLTAWLIYLADRFGDSLWLEGNAPTSLRQRFCLRHRGAWLVTSAVIAGADLLVVCTRLHPRTLGVGAAIGAVALGYLILNHRRGGIWSVLPLKEALVGFLFATGVMVALARGFTLDLLPAWILFGGLCTLNCICIAVWERELDLAQRRVSIATEFPAVGRFVLPALLILAASCCAFALAEFGPRGVYLCLMTSGLLLAVLHWLEIRIDPDSRTAMADIVLLTPLAVFIANAF